MNEKKMTKLKLGLTLSLSMLFTNAFADNLLQVFQQAFAHDPTFQQANANRLSTYQDVPINRSFLLPQFNTSAYSQYNNVISRAGEAFDINGNQISTGKGTFNYNSNSYSLDLSQTLFDYSAWAGLKQAKVNVKAADATYAAALQDLMSRTAQAYFNVLNAEDQLRYVQAEKKAIYQQLDQATQQYKVGVIAITGVYQAQASYDSIISQEIAAANNVINQRENLQQITGIYYNNLDSLKRDLPLVMPNPDDPDKWVAKAIEQNWSLTAARYNAEALKEQININFGGHLPTVNAVAGQTYLKTGTTPAGRNNATSNAAGIQLNFPVFQGGLVTGQTHQAEYNYQAALDQRDAVYRQVFSATQQGFNNVVSNINQVKADKQAIVSNASSLRSTIEAYKVGLETMLDVLQAQQDLYNAESQYSNDQYNYLNATIALKLAAGTLSLQDLQEINSWLTPSKRDYSSLNIKTIASQANQTFQDNLQRDSELANQILQAGGNINSISKSSEQASGVLAPSATTPAPAATAPASGTSKTTTKTNNPN